jgi:DNA-binding cell septation regulator SpoVG
MKVSIVSISPPTKSAALASVKIELWFENGETLVIDNIRVLKNVHNELWVGFPSRIVNGAYTQLVFASHRVKRLIEDAVIPAYEEWAGSQAAVKSQTEGGAR